MAFVAICLLSGYHTGVVSDARQRFDRAMDAPTPQNQGEESCSRYDPPAKALEEHSDIVYATVPQGDGSGTFGLLLDAHVPLPPGSYPALIFLHGGGWVSGSRSGADGTGGAEVYAKYFASQGPFVVFNIDYRMPCDPGNPYLEYFDANPHFSPRSSICGPSAHSLPAPLADVRAAIAWVVENGARYGADPGRIGVIGDSAGAHLALLAATYDRPAGMSSIKPRVAVGFSPPIDFDLSARLALTNTGAPASPVPVSQSAEGVEFDECALIRYMPGVNEFQWSNLGGTNCAAHANRAVIVGQEYQLGASPAALASRIAWNEASPRYWVQPPFPDPPVYFFIGVGEGKVLEQEGQSFIAATAGVPTMAGSAFCELSVANTLNKHAAELCGYPIEAGCFGYDPNASTQMTVLKSALRFLQTHLAACEQKPTAAPMRSGQRRGSRRAFEP